MSPAASGLGQDGYLRVQKESSYGVDIVSSMDDLPINSDTMIVHSVDQIPAPIIIGSRLQQVPDAGRKRISGPISMDAYPDEIGQFLNFLLGAATTAGPTDSTYTHYWTAPKTGLRVGTSFTCQQAIGGDLADQFAGCVITSLVISSDSEGNQLWVAQVVGQGNTSDVARQSSWTISAAIPFHFGMTSLDVNPASESNFAQLMNSFELTLDMGYDIERFKLGSSEIQEPIFNTIPTVSFKCNIDSDRLYVKYARTQEEFDLTLTSTHTAFAGGSTVYSKIVEIPKCILVPQTEIANANENLTMDLEFNGSYGGNTTNGTAVMYEIRIVDAVATYTA